MEVHSRSKPEWAAQRTKIKLLCSKNVQVFRGCVDEGLQRVSCIHQLKLEKDLENGIRKQQ